jgi:hypothetical protein
MVGFLNGRTKDWMFTILQITQPIAFIPTTKVGASG